jgi:hypothetical protein
MIGYGTFYLNLEGTKKGDGIVGNYYDNEVFNGEPIERID